MDETKSTELEQAEQRRAEHRRRLAEYGSNYAFGYLDALVQGFVDGRTTEGFLREAYAELQSDLKAVGRG